MREYEPAPSHQPQSAPALAGPPPGFVPNMPPPGFPAGPPLPGVAAEAAPPPKPAQAAQAEGDELAPPGL